MGQGEQAIATHAITASRDLGRRIARAREDAGVSQVELAGRLGWSVRTLSNLERGRRPLYTAREVADIAHLVGVTPAALRAQRRVNGRDGLAVRELLAVLSDEQLDELEREVRAERRARS